MIHACGISHLFLWDDDLEILDFDAAGFVEVMKRNNLAVAQPGIVAPFPLAHALTRRSYAHNSGRLTNFVEIMAPCYRADAWLALREAIGPEPSFDALGYDYFPFDRCGIIDRYAVQHLRPYREKSPEAQAKRNAWMESRGITATRPKVLGELT
jgi:hypothetical protein